MTTRFRTLALGTSLLAALAAPAPARAQDLARPDEALEKLLENLGEKPKADAPAPADKDKKPDDKPKPGEKAKPGEKPKPDAKPAPADKDKQDEALEKMLEGLDGPKPTPDAPNPADPAQKPGDAKPSGEPKPEADPKKAGEVGGKDQSLDKLLEGLGGADDKPAPDDRKPNGGGGAPDQPPPPGQGQGEGEKKPDPLDAASKKLDDLLEEKTGRKPKKKEGQRGQGQGQGGGDEDGGPLGDLIKQMRDVEGRLGQPDTGEETRKKQVEIVKNLDQLLEQVRNSSSQSQAMRMMRGGEKPGGPPQPGQGNQPGATGQGVGAQKPATPKTPPAPVELAKEIWGQLPTQFRDDQANVLKENPLPSKAELIRLYYLSLGKKSASSQGN